LEDVNEPRLKKWGLSAERLTGGKRTKMRYFYNGLRIWFAPMEHFQGGRNRVLAEDPVSKDKWVPSDLK
jgi:hypothetical protein